MQYEKTDLTELLDYIDPAVCSYQEWLTVGMALKFEGYDLKVWDDWSRRDPDRYHDGDCRSKWLGFNGSQTPVTAGTVVNLAKEHGWSKAGGGKELSWDSMIGEKKIIDTAWIEGTEIHIPDEWQPGEQCRQLITYLQTLFDATENVGYAVECWEQEDRLMPKRGCFDRTAGQIIEELSRCDGDIGSVIGDANKQVGAWIRFNPLDGQGVSDSNVTDFRYALVECDDLALDKQNTAIRELELPVAALVYSGKKSLHAIVRIEAADKTEYKKRVDFLYSVCRKNGLKIDTQNKNPSRLSRMPGIDRGTSKQYLLDTNIGKSSWDEWQAWIEEINDDLPEPESFGAFWEDLPELSPPLIDGVLRQGHKMLLAGPSKAGKSYALIELCIAIAEGVQWLGFRCAKGKVLYVNLEVDRASCLHRFKDVYTAWGLPPGNLQNIDIWNLRGKAVPMDSLAPKLIRRAAKKGYIAIIIDPIYKVITGDENSASEMAKFCNQFDKVCNELGCAVIYCHHHSKGGQGDKKSMDRASGSGVFARDPDAMLDLLELECDDNIYKTLEDDAALQVMYRYLDKRYPNGWEREVSDDDMMSPVQMKKACYRLLPSELYDACMQDCEQAKKQTHSKTAWRLEGTLREFPRFDPINLWFNFPVHVQDRTQVLSDLSAANSKGSPYKKNFSRKKSAEHRQEDRKQSIQAAFTAVAKNGKAKISDLAEVMGVSEKTVKRRATESGCFDMENGFIFSL